VIIDDWAFSPLTADSDRGPGGDLSVAPALVPLEA